jgi:signal transduction histidine kinase
MAGWGWTAVHHPEHLDRVVERFKQHIASGEEWEDTFPLRSRGGEYRWFLSRAFPIRDKHGRVRQWFGTNTDITEERRAQEALRLADQRKNEFISMLSHELRNPLAPIRNSIYLLERVPGDTPMANNAREVIRRQTDHLTRLVDDLLDVTRVTSGKMVLARAPTDLVEVVRAASEDHRSLIEAAGIALRVALPSAPVIAHVDAARLTQVMGNLLQNALKFSAPGGWIEVHMSAAEGWAEVGVRDGGAGIDPELLRSLFEPFVQGERSMERGQGGLGLGLALARGVVRMHGGEISARSEGRERGAEFIMRLPLGPAEATTHPLGDGADEVAVPAAPKRVLIVDDNRDAADSLAQLVELFGHDAEVAHDGPSALACFDARHPDVVLCDIGLPGMNGYEVARRMREKGAPVRLVAVSGYAQPEDLRQSAASGFDQHVAKPPAPDAIRRLLDEALSAGS